MAPESWTAKYMSLPTAVAQDRMVKIEMGPNYCQCNITVHQNRMVKSQ